MTSNIKTCVYCGKNNLEISNHEAICTNFRETDDNDFYQICHKCGLETLECQCNGSIDIFYEICDNCGSVNSDCKCNPSQNNDKKHENAVMNLEEEERRVRPSTSSGEGLEINPSYSIISKTSRFVRKFGLWDENTQIKINITDNPLEDIRKALSDILKEIKKIGNDTDQIGLTFTCGPVDDKFPGYLPYRPLSQLDIENIWGLVYGVFQSSKDNADHGNTFSLTTSRVQMPAGGARRNTMFYNTYKQECLKRKGIVTIKNYNDNLCLPRAIVVGKAHADKSPDFINLSKNKGKCQDRAARDLVQRSGVSIPETGAGVTEIQHLQNILSDYQITVFRYGERGRNPIFKGPEKHNKINLLYSDSHFNTIINVLSAFACSYYCHQCNIPFHNKLKHLCSAKCKVCRETGCVEGDRMTCIKCHIEMKSEDCFKRHFPNVCNVYKRCKICHRTYMIRKNHPIHKCDEGYCKTCSNYRPFNHLCYIQPNTGNPPLKNFLYIYFDLETRQEKSHIKGMVHEPNLCVFMQSCNICISSDVTDCTKCGKREHVIKELPVDRFMGYVLDIRNKFKEVCIISHCGGSFDVQFVLKYLLENSGLIPEVIMRGTRLLKLQFGNVRFIDSYNFLPMGLSKLPNAFGFEGAKGYFPHLFNTLNNSKYKGPMPPVEFYNPNGMFKQERIDFLKWYNEQSYFDFERDIELYCRSDVQILRQACEKFRMLFLEECNVEPFLEGFTIAGVCNLMYRRNFLKPDVISVLPKTGYRGRNSKIALDWLRSMEERHGEIRHADNGREFVLLGSPVDGFKASTKDVFQFHGCYWHGCLSCYPTDRDRPLSEISGETLESRYFRTVKRTDMLRKAGYNVIEQWECKWTGKNNSESLDEFEKLEPREAFFGGRTGNCIMYHKAEEGEVIRYVDVCSLYPYICKHGKFPVGHPEIIIGETELSDKNGLIKCIVLPPNDLYHPVLPMRSHGLLLFCLCRTCANDQNQGDCNHTEEERSIPGTWVIDEVKVAVEKGYKIIKIFEVWNYTVTQPPDGIFAEFIDKFLKIKQEASGWPREGMSDFEKDEYINEFVKREGVKMNKNNIKLNPGLRSLSKLMLNSFWGRFGMRENLPRTTIVKDPHELYTLLTNPSIQVTRITPVNDDVILVNFIDTGYREDCISTTNVVIAAMTTAQARLKLYSELEKLGEQVIYYDTDSIIYSYKPGQYEVPIGSFLGQWTDELNGKSITEFVSGGPKTYAYICDGKVTCKVKGFTLNHETSEIVNFDSLKNLVLESGKIQVPRTQILRTAVHDVVTVKSVKNLTIKIRKRRREDMDLYPFGFKKNKQIQC